MYVYYNTNTLLNGYLIKKKITKMQFQKENIKTIKNKEKLNNKI